MIRYRILALILAICTFLPGAFAAKPASRPAAKPGSAVRPGSAGILPAKRASPSAAKPKTPSTPPASLLPPDYLTTVLKNGVLRWEAKDIPIPVYISDGDNQPGYQPAFKLATKTALTEWEKASGGKIKFTLVGEPEKANITINWLSDTTKFPYGNEADNESFISANKTLSAVQIRLPTKLPNETLTATKIHAIALHALAHGLGMNAHSAGAADVLSRPPRAQQISLRDIKTLLLYYSNDPRVAAAGTFKGDTSHLDKGSRLYNEGNAAAKTGDYITALKKYEESYSLERSRQTVSNLCICYNKLGVDEAKKKNYKQAETYMRKAVPMCERGRYIESLTHALHNLVIVLQASGRNEEAARFMLDHASALSTVMESPAKRAQAILLDDEAQKLLLKGELEQAESKLREAIAIEPESASLHSNLSRCLYDQGRFDDATVESKKAIEAGSVAAWLGLAAAYERLGMTKESIDAYQQLITRDPKIPGADAIKKSIAEMQKDFEDQEKNNAFGEDYLAQTIESRVSTWKHLKRPIPVYIKDGSTVPYYRDKFKALVIEGFNEWQKAGADKFQFEFVDNPDGARIMVEWTDDRSALGRKDRRGLTKLIGGNNQIAQARIFLLTQDMQPMLAERDMRSTALHEIGHALGLEGHSANPRDVLYKASFVQSLTDRDKKTLQRLYSDNDEFVAQAIANPPKFVNKEAESDPQHEQVNKLHDEAMEAAKTGDLDKVALKYEEALAIDPYEPGVLANLCKCYNNLAAVKFKSGDMAAAEEILRKAVKTCEKGTSDEQLAFTLKNLGTLLNAAGKTDEGSKLLERAKAMDASE